MLVLAFDEIRLRENAYPVKVIDRRFELRLISKTSLLGLYENLLNVAKSKISSPGRKFGLVVVDAGFPFDKETQSTRR
jgi:hypothetical protein